MAYLDQRALDEIQVTAVGSSAEFATPGVSWTGVVKSGGNDFHGLLSYDGQYPSLQADNVDRRADRPGARAVRQQHRELLRLHRPARRKNRAATSSGSSPPTAASSASRMSLASRRPRARRQIRPPIHDDPPATRTMWNPGLHAEAVVPTGAAAPLHRVRQPLDQERTPARREPFRAARIDLELLVRPDAVEVRVPVDTVEPRDGERDVRRQLVPRAVAAAGRRRCTRQPDDERHLHRLHHGSGGDGAQPEQEPSDQRLDELLPGTVRSWASTS